MPDGPSVRYTAIPAGATLMPGAQLVRALADVIYGIPPLIVCRADRLETVDDQ